jgi:parvulin-like peptidyl-prolyl isomerase
MKTLEDGLSAEKLQKHYKDNKAQFSTPKKLQARHILIALEADAKALVKELDAAKDKKAKFIELAKSKSTGPSGKDGGDLGWFELGRMVPEFSAAADKLKIGEYTKTPVKTQFGFHLIMLDGKKDATLKPFEAVEAQIRTELSGQAFAGNMKSKTDALRKAAKIELK